MGRGTTDQEPTAPSRGPGSLESVPSERPSLAGQATAPSPERAAGEQTFGRGSTLGRLHILDEVGAGSMGTVYAAYDPHLNRKVAVKVLRPPSHLRPFDLDLRSRMLLEAQAMARLSHREVITVYDVGVLDEQVFIVMEFIDGMTLTKWVAEPGRTWREVLSAYMRAGAGLSAAHDVGLVHRDFKPDNVLVGRDGSIHVTDFGLARLADAAAPTEGFAGDSAQAVVRTADTVGTPAYMAPEQFRGRAADQRTDQFSFCVALYEGLYGQRPFAGDTVAEVRQNIIEDRVGDPHQGARVPLWLRRVLLRGLRTRREDRYPSMQALLRALDRDPAVLGRRAAYAAALLLAAGASGAVISSVVRQRGRICQGAEAQLNGVWDADRRRTVFAALMATGKPYAADAVRGVEGALDAYARGWVKMHSDACAATRLRGEQSEELLDLRMECLTERREELKSLVDILSRQDARVAERSVQAALGLTSLDGCANAAALKAPVKPPADSAKRAQVDELRKRLAQTTAMERVGKYNEGVQIAAAAVAEANGLAYRPIQAEALFRLGLLENLSGDNKAAEQTLHDAVLAAEGGRHDEMAAQAWIHLVMVGYDQAQFDRSHEASRYAFAALERLGGNEELRAFLLSHLGLVLAQEGKYSEALEQHQRALEIREHMGGSAAFQLSASLNNIGIVFAQTGRTDRALEYLQRSLAIKEKMVGTEHPSVVAPLGNLGLLFFLQGKYERSLYYAERALTLSQKAFPQGHERVANALNNIGEVLTVQGKYDQALEYLQRGLDMRVAVLGPTHPDTAASLDNISYLQAIEGKLEQALTGGRRALEIRERALGRNHPAVAESLLQLGAVLEKQGKLGDAMAQYQRALSINSTALGPSHSQVAKSMNHIGGVLRLQAKFNDALSNQQRALSIWEKTMGSEHPDLAYALTGIGETFLAMRNPKEAVGPLERALTLRQAQLLEPSLVAATRFALARALKGTQQELTRARDLAVQARQAYAQGGIGFRKELARVESWLAQ